VRRTVVYRRVSPDPRRQRRLRTTAARQEGTRSRCFLRRCGCARPRRLRIPRTARTPRWSVRGRRRKKYSPSASVTSDCRTRSAPGTLRTRSTETRDLQTASTAPTFPKTMTLWPGRNAPRGSIALDTLVSDRDGVRTGHPRERHHHGHQDKDRCKNATAHDTSLCPAEAGVPGLVGCSAYFLPT
jgi:hypothetical protein